ncbi:MAG: response regulator [Thermoanaerobaculia bacterium]|nr:response regulator [Thermoanaerobaculia bacterium]
MDPTAREREHRQARFRLAMQRNRLLTYALATVIAVIFRAAGVLEVTNLDLFKIFAFASSSTVPPAYLAWRTLRGKPSFNIDPLWLLADTFTITWGMSVSGGLASSWFIWYLAPLGAAAFLWGIPGALWMTLANSVFYFGGLIALGQIKGFDHTFMTALSQMAFLHGATSFTLWGVADLRSKRMVIAHLRENDARKVAELTRLTGALDESSKELQEANLRILEADRLKSQFLANMSHELRTPLNSIIGFSDILLTRLNEQLPPKHLKFLQNINTSGQHLLRIINDILDLSKIEAGKMEFHPEPVSVQSVVEGVCHVMKGMAAKHEVEFVIDVPANLPALETDAVKFKQVLYNLLSNAVKFSPPRSSVTVRAQLLPEANSPLGKEAILVKVIDQGAGIDPRDHEVIFQEFRQVDGGTTRKHQGTGLGLSLVKKLLELQGGAITVDSQLGKGAVFTVVLPRRFQGVRQISSASSPNLRAEGKRPRILIVEDDPVAYERIGQTILAASFIPFRARNAEEAITLAHALTPAAITLDLVLPGLDGWEILKALKSDPVTRDIPVIIISVVDNRDLGIALGAEDYLLKPVDGEHLIRRLSEILARSPRRDGPILVIDDEESAHLMISEAAKNKSFTFLHAYGGEEGLAMAQQTPPSLVVLDLMMRGMDGFEVARRMRANPVLAKTPILVLTARDLSRSDRQELAGRITALVQKGATSPANLVEIIEGLVGSPEKEAPRA